jgi:hypothetical protein
MINPSRFTSTLLLPVTWTVLCVLGFEHPGDEYGLWGFSALAGTWIVRFVDFASPMGPRDLVPWVAAAGAATMLAVGHALDRLRVRWWMWAGTALVIAPALGYAELMSYDSWQRAIARNGSLSAYVYFSLNLGLTLAAGGTLVAAVFVRLVLWWRRRLRAD